MSEVKVNKISPRTACGTVTLGDSGDTFTIPSGATITNAGTATGFGRTGTVDWQTGSIKTATFTATSGEGYFCNTTGGVLTVNLPAGSAGDIVGLKDYAGTWDSNAVTLNPNGSEKIGGGSDLDPTLTSEGGAVLLVYVDGTQGWLTTQESVTTSPSGAELFIVGTGGSPCTGAICGDYKVHSFTGPGTFTVCSLATCSANDVVDYVVVAGGAGGATNSGGGYAAAAGGAGGMRFSAATYCSPSPLKAPAALPVAAQGYPITVGGGGAGTDDGARGVSGNNSIFSTITSAGGGGGGGWPNCIGTPNNGNGVAGGSGGGAARAAGSATVGAGNTPPSSPAQGSAGGLGNTTDNMGGGGGGLTAAGSSGSPSSGADGGAGLALCITGSPVAYAGGGGGGAGPGSATPCRAPAGGLGGGGAGSQNPGPPGSAATAGTVNTGGGGGGTNFPGNTGGAGGSGIVIIRYKFQ